MALKENDLIWFRPLWRRVAVVVFLGLWLGWEVLFSGDQFWMILVGAALAYALYTFFYAFPKAETENEQIAPPRPADGENRQDP